MYRCENGIQSALIQLSTNGKFRTTTKPCTTLEADYYIVLRCSVQKYIFRKEIEETTNYFP